MSYRSVQKKIKWRPKPRGYALEAAVLALQSFINRDKKRDMSCEIIPFDSLKNEPRGRRKMSVQNNLQNLPVSNGQESRQVSVSPSQPYFPGENDWKTMLNLGMAAIKSGMLPYAIKTPEAAAIVFLKGRELGLPYMVAVAHIHVINGKPSMSAEMMQSLARKNLPGLVINILKSDDTGSEIEFIRPEKGSRAYVSKFSLENAKTAQLLGKDVWKQYPAAMLFSRAISAGLRKVCPEALMGVSYTPEELGAPVDQEGNVIETTGRSVPHDEHLENILKEKAEVKEVIKPRPSSGPSAAQLSKLFAIAKSKGMTSKEQVKDWISNTFDYKQPFSLTELNQHEIQDVFNEMEKVNDLISTPPPAREPGDDSEDFPTSPGSGLDPMWQKFADKGNF